MKIGDKIAQIRKDKGFSREHVGKAAGTSGPMIGKYERNEMTPSVDMAVKIADVLNVSLDYLAGTTSTTIKDKKMAYRLELLEQISDENRDFILKVLDTLLKDAQNTDIDQKLAS